MTLIEPVPFDQLGTIYEKWEDAPLGKLLSSAAHVAIPNNKNSYDRSQHQRIAIRAKANSNSVLVSIAPDPLLLFEAKEYRMFSPAACFGPAIDIGSTHQLAVTNLGPMNEAHEFNAGDVVRTPGADKMFLVVAYPDYANRGLVLNGDEQWIVTDMPHGLLKIGSISVVPRKVGA